MVQGIGYKDADGSYGFRMTEDGKVILGNSSDDLIQVSGTLDVSGSIYGTDSIYVDVIRRHEDSSTTTKIRLMDEEVRIHAGNANDEVLKAPAREDPEEAAAQVRTGRPRVERRDVPRLEVRQGGQQGR